MSALTDRGLTKTGRFSLDLFAYRRLIYIYVRWSEGLSHLISLLTENDRQANRRKEHLYKNINKQQKGQNQQQKPYVMSCESKLKGCYGTLANTWCPDKGRLLGLELRVKKVSSEIEKYAFTEILSRQYRKFKQHKHSDISYICKNVF